MIIDPLNLSWPLSSPRSDPGCGQLFPRGQLPELCQPDGAAAGWALPRGRQAGLTDGTIPAGHHRGGLHCTGRWGWDFYICFWLVCTCPGNDTFSQVFFIWTQAVISSPCPSYPNKSITFRDRNGQSLRFVTVMHMYGTAVLFLTTSSHHISLFFTFSYSLDSLLFVLLSFK